MGDSEAMKTLALTAVEERKAAARRHLAGNVPCMNAALAALDGVRHAIETATSHKRTREQQTRIGDLEDLLHAGGLVEEERQEAVRLAIGISHPDAINEGGRLAYQRITDMLTSAVGCPYTTPDLVIEWVIDRINADWLEQERAGGFRGPRDPPPT